MLKEALTCVFSSLLPRVKIQYLCKCFGHNILIFKKYMVSTLMRRSGITAISCTEFFWNSNSLSHFYVLCHTEPKGDFFLVSQTGKIHRNQGQPWVQFLKRQERDEAKLPTLLPRVQNTLTYKSYQLIYKMLFPTYSN